mmetsp:Transcript_4361/g.7435  ORF Transcript_4361/g.7435 Transcript_4361/m.7435 type:complete len:231 (+) Transcript_4361:207-899(+)|eukprot:CAMPEP_0203756444 /NCGR_PEP_ID=MMETSP0098-20131031/9738_1 /ASSEMBLY_ACC=CAM_ASM_000208 /TAXON_ID=96639 /ORGANISM=" , Strain NY0313808BC1" /LENGTH=230 /DNA_ID=CAMNT_0050648339 /DNA_START=174 /DNA_END=866 /DNA_ORIENTATION=+
MTMGLTLVKQRLFHRNGKESKEFTQALKNVEKVLDTLRATERQITNWLADAEKLDKTTVRMRNAINLATPLERRPETDQAEATSSDGENTKSLPKRAPKKLDRTALKDIQAKIKSIRALANTAKSDLQKERVDWKRAQRKYLTYGTKAAKCDGEDREAKKQKYEQKMNYWKEKETTLKQKQTSHCKQLLEKMNEIKCQVDKEGTHVLIRQELANIQKVQHEYFSGFIEEF